MDSKKSYFQTYKDSYTSEFPCIKKSSKGEKYVFCEICRSDFMISHGSRNDVYRHVTGSKHAENVKIAEKNNKLSSFFMPANSGQDDVIHAELLFTSFLVEHNVPLSAASHAGPLFRKMFPNNKIAKRYGCGKTKTASLVREKAKDRTSVITQHLKEQAFSTACDGSNESDYKLYPVVVSFFNKDLGCIETTLLAIPDLNENSTGENISALILNVFAKYEIPFENCIAFSADNAAVMQGKKNGVISYLEKINENIISIGCCCHLIHLASEKAATALPVKVDEILIDIFYYLKKSANRKNSLQKFQELYGKETQKILKHVSTRWLSLGKALARLINQWEPLTSFFRKEIASHNLPPALSLYKIPKVVEKKSITDDKSTQRLVSKDSTEATTSMEKKDRLLCNGNSKAEMSTKKKEASLNKQGTNRNKKRKIPVSEIKAKKQRAETSSALSKEEKIFLFLSSDVNKAYSLFLLAVIPTFERVNTVLQSASPQIYRLRALLLDLLKELYSYFVKPSEIKGKELTEVNFHSSSCQKNSQDIVVGSAASDLISKCSMEEQELFYTAVKGYFVTACEYIIKKFPIQNDVLENVEVADLNKIETSSFASIKYFIDLFPFLLREELKETKIEALDLLQKQFCQLQLEDLTAINVPEKEIDVQWAQIRQLRGADGILKYERLAGVILSILSIPHSNAECERIFSLVRKNRTESRAVMSNTTLEALLILKTQDSKVCYEQQFKNDFLKRAKKATAATLNLASTSAQAADFEENCT